MSDDIAEFSNEVKGATFKDAFNFESFMKDKFGQFEINANNDDFLSDEFFDLMGIDDKTKTRDLKGKKMLLTEIADKIFSEFKRDMIPLSNYIHKKIICEGNGETVSINSKATLNYESYWEKEKLPYDSATLTNQLISELLPGLKNAVISMRSGEEAQFLISYKLLFGELGCPPLIKPKADTMYIIKLHNFVSENETDSNCDVETNFQSNYDKAVQIYDKGIEAYKLGNINLAIQYFNKAVDDLLMCRLRDENDEIQQKNHLIRLYTNLAICYNKVNNPRKACLKCNELKKLQNGKISSKILFHEGRALSMLGEISRAKQVLLKAQKKEPNNTEITRELDSLTKKIEAYEKEEKAMWNKVLEINTEND